jgi:uncharacterized protein
MRIRPLPEMVGRANEWALLAKFVDSPDPLPTLGIVWGRRRVGKSYLLETLAIQSGGFYFHARRGSAADALRELGERLGEWRHAPTSFALDNWEQAISALLSIGEDRQRVVVIDEFPYLLEHSPELESMLQRAFGAKHGGRQRNQTRLILCGSALSVMGSLLVGTAPLRGRASLDLRVDPFDFRLARVLHGVQDLQTALRTYAVIGGVAAYAREMTNGDLPKSAADFDRWVCERVLSPASPLLNEIDFLLSDDPSVGKARKLNLYHSTLAAIASGRHTWSGVTNYVKVAGPSLAPILDTLLASQFVERIVDPVRDNRVRYQPGDSLIRFHYAVTRPRLQRLARFGAPIREIWREALPSFHSRVIGPSFEMIARYWTSHFAHSAELGGAAAHVGPTVLTLDDGSECELDVVVAADDADVASERTVAAIGEAKSAEPLSTRDLTRLERARTALGPRANAATLLLFGSSFSHALVDRARERDDVRLIGLDTLYGSSA